MPVLPQTLSIIGFQTNCKINDISMYEYKVITCVYVSTLVTVHNLADVIYVIHMQRLVLVVRATDFMLQKQQCL